MSGRQVTIVIDGREVTATEGEMLHDAATRGDVEIPVFCYEPKLGDPVGACRMCLVEVEGIPKLQTSCSMPVRDGMVVHTRTEQVKHAQSAVVEFLLVNHPLDCPVCDKGGECPLQDIAMGWGPGKSRFTDDKRHFQKPVPLSPLVAIDRERCILCYRCVRFSQEISEDEQLHLLERGDRSFVGTFDDRSYVAPFHGNITELCPVGALTSYTYRFRARPWDIEQAGSVCTLCPSQCNVAFTVRDEEVKRVMARDNAEVDDGWLCDKGRYSFEMLHGEGRIEGPRLKGGQGASWDEALEKAAAGLREAGAASAVIVGDASNEEAWLAQRLLREALGSPHVDSRAARGPSHEALARLSAPELSVAMRDIDDADAVLVVGADPLDAMPILDLRIRKAMRRNGTKLAVATERPTALDGGAEAVGRYAPGGATAFLSELAGALGRAVDFDPAMAGEKSTTESGGDAIAETLRDAGKVVIVWGERIGREGDGAVQAILAVADALGLAGREGSGLLEVPDFANARGLREAGCLPGAGPGLTPTEAGKGTEEIRAALESRELKSVVLVGADPLRDFPDTEAWKRALTAADHVVAFSLLENETTAAADVVFPMESHAEKEGTVTHPDGRLQRVRPSASSPGDVRPARETLAKLCAALGHDTGVTSAPEALAALADSVPFYAEVTEEEIGGRGVRWQDREQAANFRTAAGRGRQAAADEEDTGVLSPDTLRDAPAGNTESRDAARGVASGEGSPVASSSNGALKLGTYRDIWAGPVTELNSALRFLSPTQQVEMSPADAEKLGLSDGDEVTVGSNGTKVGATVKVHERLAPGACFLIEGTAEGNANGLLNGGPVEVTVEKVSS